MILLLGSRGYIGSEFYTYLTKIDAPFMILNYENCTVKHLRNSIKHYGITHIINAAGYTGKPNVDCCEIHKAETIHGNITFVKMLVDICEEFNIVFGHISSGCIYTGKRADGKGFTELDTPNFTFTQNNCSFYSGTKAIGEQIVNSYSKSYNFRLRIPFDNVNHNRNYITKLMSYDTLLEAENSISNKKEFVRVCVKLIIMNAPYGTYNIVNTGEIVTSQVVDMLKRTIGKNKIFKFFNNIDAFYQLTNSTPRSNCVLDNSKILACGIKMDTAEDSLLKCMNNWIL
jgi:UDP-glucose 4,6-dehydratase